MVNPPRSISSISFPVLSCLYLENFDFVTRNDMQISSDLTNCNSCLRNHNKTVWALCQQRRECISVMLCYKFLSRIASSFLRVNCYQRASYVGGPGTFNSLFGHGIRPHNIRPLDNHLPGLSISLGAQLSISITIFQVFSMTRLWLELTTSRSGGERSTFTLPVGEVCSSLYRTELGWSFSKSSSFAYK